MTGNRNFEHAALREVKRNSITGFNHSLNPTLMFSMNHGWGSKGGDGKNHRHTFTFHSPDTRG